MSHLENFHERDDLGDEGGFGDQPHVLLDGVGDELFKILVHLVGTILSGEEIVDET